MGKILCIGHAAYDITLLVNCFPVENTKTRIGDAISCGGGAAANAASVLAKWGMETYFAGMIGKDYYGDKVKKELQSEKINLDYFEQSDHFKTTISYIIANIQNGSRTIIISRTKQEESNIKTIDIKPEGIILDGEELALSKQALLNNLQAISVLDAGNLKPNIVELGKMVTYLICSLDFAEEYCHKKIDITNRSSIISCYDILVNDFKTNIIITLGSLGSFTKFNDYELIPSIKVKAIDSTGAGDIYHGAFLYFILNGYKLRDSMRLANIAGAISTEKVGGKYSIPTLEEVFEREQQDAII
ncbi:MAG: carbohydrate kinase family protein [Bacilli bacterium]